MFAGNVVTLALLQDKKLDLKRVFRNLISTLLLSDSFCILFSYLIFSAPHVSHHFEFFVSPRIIPFILPLTQISLTVSIATTVLVALERFVSICHPQYQVTPGVWLRCCATVLFFSIAINICKYVSVNSY